MDELLKQIEKLKEDSIFQMELYCDAVGDQNYHGALEYIRKANVIKVNIMRKQDEVIGMQKGLIEELKLEISKLK